MAANADKSFQGSIVLGMGFVLTPEEAEALMAKDPRNRDVLFPYLNGEDLNSRPDQSPSRWVINFRDWPVNRSASGRWRGASEKRQKAWRRSGIVPSDYSDPVAADYPDCLKIVEAKVKPERATNRYSKSARERWWLYERWRPELYATIAGLDRVLVIPETTKYCVFTLCPTNLVFSHMTKVVAFGWLAEFALLSSTIHEVWARTYSSTLETRLKYITTDAFETFPFPGDFSILSAGGHRYSEQRTALMRSRREGMTRTYNRFHEPREQSDEILQLRQLHVEMDRGVAAAYGWTDLVLGHGFHDTEQGIRFTTSESARREVLARLLKLNHERYAEEVKQGLHEQEGARVSRRGGRIEEDDLFLGGGEQ